MAAFFTIGEQKTRPGVYFRYENYGTPPIAGADDGRCAAALRSNWGPLGQAVPLGSYEDITKVYGDGGPNGTTAVALEEFRGGARMVFAIRLGSGGTNGAYQIMDTTTGTALAAIGLAMKYPGSRAFTLTIRPTISDPNTGELLLLEDTTLVERFTFDITEGVDQVAALIAAVEAQGSAYFTLTDLGAGGTGVLATVDQAAITPGTDPASYTVQDYSNAFGLLEPYRWNVLAIDTTDTATQMMMQMYLNRVYTGGKWVQGVAGQPTSLPFETRLSQASAFNDYQIVYVGSGFRDMAGATCDGWLAAARIAGLIAGTPSNESITHLALTGAVELTEALTNYQYEEAIKGGMLTFSLSAANTVWVEQGINTLILPGTKEDAGWKKIKRVKVRFELFQRINDTVEGLIGRVNNDPDGRMTIIQATNGVCNAMMAERKLLAGAHCEIDPDNDPVGDSAWFLVYADDIDALEKMYVAFRFRFAPSAAA
jgi:hypothetical protein